MQFSENNIEQKSWWTTSAFIGLSIAFERDCYLQVNKPLEIRHETMRFTKPGSDTQKNLRKKS